LDDNTVEANGKELLVGRDKEINQLLHSVDYDKSITLLTGESGVGKSGLLNEFYSRLTCDEDKRRRIFVGYYSRKESLVAESKSLDYPAVALSRLIKEAKELQSLDERIDNTIARIKKGLIKFAREEGLKIGVAIIEDLAKKVGLEQTLEVGKDVLRNIGTEKTSLMLAEGYVADHRLEASEAYVEIFQAIAEEFQDRRFVLIFDQFEYLGKASVDLFLNLVKFRPERFHIIVSFRTDDRT
jgi:predicted ATPase